MTQLCRPRNWNEFQHYKDRRPPWIKLHRALLDDREYQRLPLASRALAPMLWLLASESEDGSLDVSIEELTFRLRQPERDIEAGLKPLISAGFFKLVDGAGSLLAGCEHVAVPEEKRVEAETDAFSTLFWPAYPKKAAKPAAAKAFKSAKINEHLLPTILADIERRKAGQDWQKESGMFVPNPATYLNQRRWEDDVTSPANAEPKPWEGAR